jgi:cytochrome b
MGDITLMAWHLRLGYLALGLLLFRAGWALWGGRYARVTSFRTSPSRFIAHFRGRGGAQPRTAPGVALAILLMAGVTAQAVSGLFTTDDIFTSGPLVRHASSETVGMMTWLHNRVFWAVIALISVHLLAHLIYALRRDPTALSMFTGRKRVAAEPVHHLPVRALVTAAAAAAAVWWGLSIM